jgi:NADH dehydrogenase (ubiquinone) 1 beta subcomplex subunit 4
LSIRAWLKWEYLLQYNPKCQSHTEAPARSVSIYPNFRPTPKNSLLEAVVAFGPLIFWYYVFKTDRDRKERLIQKGNLKSPTKFGKDDSILA